MYRVYSIIYITIEKKDKIIFLNNYFLLLFSYRRDVLGVVHPSPLITPLKEKIEVVRSHIYSNTTRYSVLQ